MELYRVEQIAEGDYGCEELPEGAPVLCSVTLRGPDGASLVVEVPDQALTAQSIQEGCTVLRQGGSLQLVRPIRTSALIGLGALGILFGRKMPGVQVIADSLHGPGHAGLHCAAEGDTVLKLLSNVLRHKLRILVWSFDLFDVDDKLLVCETGKFAFYLLDLGSALTDDNARFCGVDHDLYTVRGSLDLHSGDTRVI